MQKMESQLASLTAWVQTAMYKQGKTGVAIGDSTSSIHRSAIISAPNSVKSSKLISQQILCILIYDCVKIYCKVIAVVLRHGLRIKNAKLVLLGSVTLLRLKQ